MRRGVVGEELPVGRVAGVEERRALHSEQAAVGERHARADVGLQRPHGALELDGRPRRVQQPVLRTELLRVGDAILGLLYERRVLIQSAHEQIAGELLQSARERAVCVVGPDRLGARQAHRAAVQAGGEAHDRDAGLRVAGHDRPLDRSSAPPARQERGMDVQNLVLGQQRLLDQRTEGAHHDALSRATRRAGVERPRDQLPRLRIVHALRLLQGDRQLACAVRDRRRGQPPASAAGTVRPGDDERWSVRVAAGEAFEHRCGELGGADVDGAQSGGPGAGR